MQPFRKTQNIINQDFKSTNTIVSYQLTWIIVVHDKKEIAVEENDIRVLHFPIDSFSTLLVDALGSTRKFKYRLCSASLKS
jgi:hypothetical protein